MEMQSDKEENRRVSSLGTQLELLGGLLAFYSLTFFDRWKPALPIILAISALGITLKHLLERGSGLRSMAEFSSSDKRCICMPVIIFGV